MSDNPILNVNGESLDRLKAVMALTDQKVAKGYAISDNRIVFFWADHSAMVPLPAPASMDRCAELAFDWLKSGATFASQPDHDGDNHKGWRCFRQGWGHIEPFGWQAFVAVEPCWMMYGK